MIDPDATPIPGEFVQKTYSLGADQLFPWEKALAAADAIEDQELMRKLARRADAQDSTP
jgi:hypothetical protein